MSKIKGFYNDYYLSSITYIDKVGKLFTDEENPFYVTYKDMNDIKNVINTNSNTIVEFSNDIYEKINNLELENNLLTEDEATSIMKRLNII